MVNREARISDARRGFSVRDHKDYRIAGVAQYSGNRQAVTEQVLI
jgi:hypothetical protein